MSAWGDIAIVVATFFGPIAAVQAQKWTERRREEGNRKVDVFVRLMATRAAKVSPEHVRALNMIDLAFYGKQTSSGAPKRTKEEIEVLAAWQEYYLHLNPNPRPADPAAHMVWRTQADELFLNLLEKMAAATRYTFDRNQLRSRHYSPEAAGNLDQAQTALLFGASEILAGKRPLGVRIEQAPPAPAQAVTAALNGTQPGG